MTEEEIQALIEDRDYWRNLCTAMTAAARANIKRREKEREQSAEVGRAG